MKIPYVIDNITHRLGDVLNKLLTDGSAQQLDVATAYFSISGWRHLQDGLAGLDRFRLLLGDEPQSAERVGVRQQPTKSKGGLDSVGYLRRELNAAPLTPETAALVEDLVRFLRRPETQVRLYLGHEPEEAGRRRFLHAKAYLVYSSGDSQSIFQDIYPLVAIVGSSNFTAPGLFGNRELNLVHKTLLAADEIDDPAARQRVHYRQGAGSAAANVADTAKESIKSEVGARAILDVSAWYEAQWAQARDYKDELIELLENSKFGGREYTPYEVYMKALFEYFRDDLEGDEERGNRSAVELTEFQEDAVKKARRILARYDGVIVADSVGLGKTWIGKKLLEEYAYHQRQKALIICPASLRPMWTQELREAAIAGTVISQERLGQPDFEPRDITDVDIVLVDEAHNFRNRHAARYQNLELLLAANGRRGRSDERKKLIMLTATPINNNIFDLYNQINLFTGNDRSYFTAAGIGDLYNYFLAARRESIEQGSIRIFNLLEEVVVRRTRQFIRTAYPDATIGGRQITWPQRRLRTVEYDLESTYEGYLSLHRPKYRGAQSGALQP